MGFDQQLEVEIAAASLTLSPPLIERLRAFVRDVPDADALAAAAQRTAHEASSHAMEVARSKRTVVRLSIGEAVATAPLQGGGDRCFELRMAGLRTAVSSDHPSLRTSFTLGSLRVVAVEPKRRLAIITMAAAAGEPPASPSPPADASGSEFFSVSYGVDGAVDSEAELAVSISRAQP